MIAAIQACLSVAFVALCLPPARRIGGATALGDGLAGLFAAADAALYAAKAGGRDLYRRGATGGLA